jgi:hypothetical protein
MTDANRATLIGNRRGIALPLVLLLTVLLTISISAGFMLASNEHQVGTDHDAQIKAFAVAQQGVERYLTDVTTLPTTFPDVRTITVAGGTATVTLRQVRAAGSGFSAIYAVTSVGDATSKNLRRSASTPVAERSISQFVTWQSASITANAAWTSLSGLSKNGNSGTASGINSADPTTGCAGAGDVIAGIAVPNALFSQAGGSSNWIDGNPDDNPAYLGTPGPTGTAVDAIGVDWAGILAGAIAPDFTLSRVVTPNTGAWPTTAQFANWPVVLVKGNITNADNVSAGLGTLVVTGNADLSNFIWHGVVLVGGTLTMSGSQGQIWGTAISGLNIQLGQTVVPSAVGNGNIVAQYNSCDIAKALLKLGGWHRVQNTWADNWPTYTVP